MCMNPYLAGMLAGDGCKFIGKNGAYAVWIDQHKKNLDILERAIKVLKENSFKTYIYNVPDNKRRVLTYSKGLYQEFEDMMKNLENFFEKLSEEEKKIFIAGFFDAEGTITDRLVIYNGNKKLLDAFQKFFKDAGMISYVYKFGKIFGLQIYRKKSVEMFKKEIQCVKITRLSG